MSRARYVAIITDGNGRWAEQRGVPTIEGHRAGADVVKDRLRDAARLGIAELTVFSFSTENWSRSDEEVTGLMQMFGERITSETPELDFGGRSNAVHRPPGGHRLRTLTERMEWAERTTAANERITLFVAFNYGGRARSWMPRGSFPRRHRRGVPTAPLRAGHARPRRPDPDERRKRISNYLLWQCAYSEFVFRDELWPDFSREAFEEALAEYERRGRRFGSR